MPGIEPVSPALAGRFLTTRKVPIIFFLLKTIFLYSIRENLLSMCCVCILEKEHTKMSKTMSLFPRNLQFMGGTGQL